MNCEMPIKSVSPSIKRNKIYQYQINDQYKRLAIQTDEEDHITHIIEIFLEKSVNEFDILLKDHSGEYDKQDEIIWKYFIGKAKKEEINNGIQHYHNTIFHDGNNQFLIKRTIDQEYICFDDHGILYLYLQDYDYIEDELSDYINDKKGNHFINMKGHWHYRFKEADKYLLNLIDQFRLENG